MGILEMVVLHFGMQGKDIIEQTNGKCHMRALTCCKTIISDIPTCYALCRNVDKFWPREVTYVDV
jgi:hypothetical protein